MTPVMNASSASGATTTGGGGNPSASTLPADRISRLVGCGTFVRNNPMSDRFATRRFHHVEFWCPDATNAYKRLQLGLGMGLAAKSDQSTGNPLFASYVLKSNELVFTITAPYSRAACEAFKSGSGVGEQTKVPHRLFDSNEAYRFIAQHGLGVRAVGIEVEDARLAYDESVKHGGIGVNKPAELVDEASGGKQVVSEVKLYGDVVLRYVSGEFDGPFLAGFQPVGDGKACSPCYGLQRLDHAVGNVENLLEVVNYLARFTGFHEFAEFTAEDVGTVDSGLNSIVLASNNELVLLPVNEPTFNTKRKSQIQTYLEQNEGSGLQHLALKTDDIISTLTEMRRVSELGGMEFMPRPSDEYYRKLPDRIGDGLTPQQYKDIERLGLLADKDDQGILLQIFTRPISDRPTIFLEIIQRIGCLTEVKQENGVPVVEQAGGCGGFGKGNFTELFKSIEDYERTLKI